MARILTVDDSNSLRRMVAFTLKQAGHEVVQAVDGSDGLVKIREQKIDLALVDVNMPSMGGIEMVTEMRKLPEYAKTPILMLTTESSDEKKQEGRQAGATGWIVKPFSPEQLLGIVEKVLGRTSPA
ncbi:response regulator [Chromatocurvus halotolerans]|uniref:Two-component system chemotaxis response regulator CheY n=1 Tax=Chromatocurvus halotolerans TaxID=1132028 RepID=A0A4R2KYR8_9GAMM|nr:response regulator [Chromatocurvus halotolerans]TCO76569.1 two-component system chemotaxis response regulator CheY [Chromatocurvus halotolerans]